MSEDRDVSVGAQEYRFSCDCGWSGLETDVDRWDVQTDRDRVVRRCPGCDEPVPEWGTFPSIDGVARIAKGDLRAALDAEGVLD